jgi:signal transduction histidine kinase
MIISMWSYRDQAARRMDWLVFNLRWLVLVAAGLLILITPGSSGPTRLAITLLAVTGLYNIGLSLLEFSGFWHRFLFWGSRIGDFVLALGLFVGTGGITGPLIWIGLLPGLTTALRHRWVISLGVISAFTLAQAAFLAARQDDLLPLFFTALILWPVIAGVALVSQRVRANIRAAAHRARDERERRIDLLKKQALAIYDMSSMVSATLDYVQVLDAVLNIGSLPTEDEQDTYPPVVSAVLFFHEDQLHVASARRLTPTDNRVVCPGRSGVLEKVIRTGEPTVIADPATDPELQQFVGFRACRSLMALPLRAGFETHGVVLFGHLNRDFFDEDQWEFLEAVVNQAIIALQNAQLYHKLSEEKERLVEVQEEAQKKLARDLHDGPTQSVAALAMRANFVRRLMDRDSKAAAEELFKMEDLARRTTKEIRHMLFTLRPLVLESQGLTAALKQLAEKMHDTHGQNVIVETEPGIEEKLELNQKGVLFYIAEEAVGNARKHAQAQHIWVRLRTQKDVLVLEIQDDGVGFNVGAVQENYDKRGSLGMVNMRERAELLNGAVRIDSEEGKGTRIDVLVPLNEFATDGV